MRGDANIPNTQRLFALWSQAKGIEVSISRLLCKNNHECPSDYIYKVEEVGLGAKQYYVKEAWAANSATKYLGGYLGSDNISS